LLVIGGTTLLYSVAGGIRKDIATDVFQVVIVFVGLVVLGLAMICGRGLSFTNVPASHFTFTGYGVFFPIGVLLFFSPSFVGRYDFWQRIIAAKSTSEARFALWLSLPMIIAAYIVCCLIGICARSMSPSTDSAHAAIWFMREALPGGLSLVVTLAFYAALMATSDTLLGVSAVSFSSIAQTVLSSHRKSLRTVTFIRCVTVLVGVGASATVLLAADTVDLIIGGFSSLVILTPGLLFVLLNRAPSALVACASLFFGYGSFLTAFLLVPPYRKYAFILGFLIACAAVGVGHLASRILPRRAEAHDRT
jgi:SSS family solute:Na+ symporter